VTELTRLLNKVQLAFMHAAINTKHAYRKFIISGQKEASSLKISILHTLKKPFRLIRLRCLDYLDFLGLQFFEVKRQYGLIPALYFRMVSGPFLATEISAKRLAHIQKLQSNISLLKVWPQKIVLQLWDALRKQLK